MSAYADATGPVYALVPRVFTRAPARSPPRAKTAGTLVSGAQSDGARTTRLVAVAATAVIPQVWHALFPRTQAARASWRGHETRTAFTQLPSAAVTCRGDHSIHPHSRETRAWIEDRGRVGGT